MKSITTYINEARSHTYTPSELTNLVLANIKDSDKENISGTFSSFGSAEIRFATKDGGMHRWFETKEGKSTVSGHGCPRFETTKNRYVTGSYNYAKLSTAMKKEFYNWFSSLKYELCTTDEDYSFIQEVGADKVTFEMDNDGEPMNIVKRVPIKLF